MPTDSSAPVHALLLIGPGCPHCAALLDILGKLVKQGDIGQLDIVNVAQMPQVARKHSVRSVPWLRLGEFELEGAQSEGDIKHWLEQARSSKGMGVYLRHLLSGGKLQKVTNLVQARPQYLSYLVPLVADPEQDFKVQLGISALFEELEGSEVLHGAVEELGKLTRNENAKVRADAAHLLSFTHSAEAKAHLQALLNDDNADVREIARDATGALH
jgi:thioredoxin-like negative regulator of GroEL